MSEFSRLARPVSAGRSFCLFFIPYSAPLQCGASLVQTFLIIHKRANNTPISAKESTAYFAMSFQFDVFA